MKVNFFKDDQQVTLLSPDELLEFRDETEARFFLSLFAHNPDNMDILRQVLGEQYNAFTVSGLSDAEVVDHMATLVARSCLGWIRVELREIVPPDLVDANAADDDLEMEDEPLAEEEQELEDVKPKPVIPPIFPVIARLESDKIEFERRLYNITLDLMRYAGWPWPDLSDVAETLQQVAGSTRIGLEEASQGFANQLLGLGNPAALLSRATEVGAKFTEIARITGTDLEAISGRAAEGLERLLRNAAEAPAPSEVIPAFMAVVENQSTEVVRATRLASESLGALAGGVFEPAAPSQLASLLQSFAKDQGQGVADAAGRAAELVRETLSRGMDQPQQLPALGGLVLEAMTAAVSDTAQGVVNAVGPVAAGLAPLGAVPRRAAAALTEAAGDAAGAAAGAVSAAGDALAAAAGDDLGAAVGALTRKALGDVRPPDWLRDPEGQASAVVTRMHQSLLEQTEGVLRATTDAADFLSRLKAPVKAAVAAVADEASAAAAAAATAAGEAAGDTAAAVGEAAEAAGDAAADAVGAAASALLAKLDVSFDASTVKDALGNPSALGDALKRTVRDQGVSLVGLALDFSNRVSKLGPPVIRRVMAAADEAAARVDALLRDDAPPTERPPGPSASRPAYHVPEAPPIPAYETPTVELPPWDILPPEA